MKRNTLVVATVFSFFPICSPANPAGRLYIKYNGKVAAAIDPAGNLFSRGSKEYSWDIPYGGLIFKKNGVAQMSVREESPTDQALLGKLVSDGGVWEQNSVPFGPTGTLRVNYNGVGKFEIDDTYMVLHAVGNYARKFGYRKNAALLKPVERANFVDAVLWMDTQVYPGQSGVENPAGSGTYGMGAVSYWDKFTQIHAWAALMDIHHTPVFLPWHRELTRRFEDLMQQYDPIVFLPYWDWTSDPKVPDLRGYDNIPLIANPGDPYPVGWLGERNMLALSVPNNIGSPFNILTGVTALGDCSSSRNCTVGYSGSPTNIPSDPPDRIFRQYSDPSILPTIIIEDNALAQIDYQNFRYDIETIIHDNVHQTISGNFADPYRTTEDPLFFIMHANVDRLWSKWQLNPLYPERLTYTEDDYGAYGSDQSAACFPSFPCLNDPIDPWAGFIVDLRPWAAPDNQEAVKYYKDNVLLKPRLYDDP